MLNIWRQLWNQIDLIFFGVYLWIIPFSWRKVLVPSVIPGHVGFNEYTDVSIYVSDIFLLLAVAIFVIRNRNHILSILMKIKMFHVEHFYLIIPFLLSLYAYLSVFWSDQRLLGFYSAFIFMEGPIIFYYLLGKICTQADSECSTWNIIRFIGIIFITSALFQSIIGIFQFVQQSSIGLKFLNESILDTSIPGVAEILIQSIPVMRSYGTFLHPNIFAGYLFLSIILIFLFKRIQLFHVEQFNLTLLISIVLVAIVLSVSKSAILALILAMVLTEIVFRVNNRHIVPRGTIIRIDEKMFHPEHFWVIIIAIFSFVGLYWLDTDNLRHSIQERFDLIPKTEVLINEVSMFGVGIGQYVYNLSFTQAIDWKVQPIHNVYIMLLIELGYIGLTLYTYFLYKLLIIVPRGTIETYLWSICIGFIFIGVFDHYLFDIRSGQSIIWISFGLLASIKHLTSKYFTDIIY